jgi:hypothetical protein
MQERRRIRAKSLPNFGRGLAATGFVEGRNVAIEYRWRAGRYDLLPEFIGDLVRRQVAVIAIPNTTTSALAAIAWKAQVRLCARYRRLMAAGKRQTLITTAIAREMAAFLWAIGQEVQPCSA